VTFLDGLKAWQDLAAGGLALLAAAGVATVVEVRERTRLSRQHRAARAVLPLALSGVVAFAETSIAGLMELITHASGSRVRGLPEGRLYQAPEIDPALIEPLRDAISTVKPSVGKRLAQLLAEMQVVQSNLSGLAVDLAIGETTVTSVEDFIYRALLIRARSDELFEYARAETERAPLSYPSAKTLVSALNIMGFDRDRSPRLYLLAETRAERNRRSWLARLARSVMVRLGRR
jgi:hypothetical protein